MEKVAEMGCRYFDLASEDILSIIPLVPSGDEVMKDTLKQTKMDVGFMKLFYLCLAQWDFTSDKQSMERLTSMITSLEDIWGMSRGERMILNRHRYILYLYRRRESESGVDDFHTRVFLTEEQIRQSKIMIDEWYGNLLNSVKEKCKSLTSAYSDSTLFLRHINEILEEFLNCRAVDIVPFKKHIVIHSRSILLSSKPSLHNLLDKFVESFVASFFEHMSITIPKDDFLIFRDNMIDHFTFLAYHPHVNAEESLSDFMIKTETAFAKAILNYYGFSDSWIGLEAAKMVYIYFHSLQREISLIEKHAKRSNIVHSQLYLYEEMELRFLKTFLLWLATFVDNDKEIRCFMTIFSLQEIWGKEKEENALLVNRSSAISRRDFQELHRGYFPGQWHPFDIEVNRKIQMSKLEIEPWLVNWFHCTLQSKPLTSNKILKFIDSILNSLNALVNCRADKMVTFKKQTETLENKLVFLHNWLKLSENCSETKELGEFKMLIQVFAIDAAFITFHYWVKEGNDINETEVNCMLSDMLQKIKPITPDVARLYFEVFKAIYLQRSNSLLFGQTASIFVDVVFEYLMTHFKDDFQILRDNIIFLLTFLNDPPDGDAEELIHSQIDNHFWEGVYCLLPIEDMKGDFSEKKTILRCVMKKIETVNAEIRKHYCQFPDTPLYNLPKITSQWNLDFFIQNLRNLKERMINDRKFVPFAKYMIIKFEEELVSLSPLFNYIFELQNELNDTWVQVVAVIHLTERVINSCISSWFVFDHPIWYYMAYLSYVFDRIKRIKTNLEKIKENMKYNVRCLPHSPGVIRTLSNQTWTSDINEVMVGFEDDAKTIINDLTRGHKSLDIVSIVGMGGLGKTALAKNVFSVVKDDFRILAFYCVSQNHDTRMLLLGILKSIINVDDEITRMTNDDLAHKLWRCLSRRKYLIVLDDIWNINVWNEVKRSFPDDQNGSRVMFTTRFHEVANKCKIQCRPFHLRFLSKVESWELLQHKVFQEDISPPNLSNIGRQIAESCKGLPLAIVVIAGLLARKERSESAWSEIAEKVLSLLSDDEGCMKILEVSYNHLPDYLKPCMLYLGAYPEDELIKVNQVIQLWIAEGFVQKSETKSIEDAAKEYFHDLVERSLVIVSGRSSGGEIKTFKCHDLIHNMCQTKCHEGNFFKLGHEIASSSSGGGMNTLLVDFIDYFCQTMRHEGNFSMYDHYRISVVPATISDGSSSVGDASTLLFFGNGAIHEYSSFMKLRLAQVLYAEDGSNKTHFRHMLSLVNLRHLHVCSLPFSPIISSISNLWNLQSLIITYRGTVDLPETFWKLKSLRYVKVKTCSLKFSDHAHEQLDKAVSFSTARLSSAKDVEKLLLRLPAVRKLGINMCPDSGVKRVEVEPLDLCRKLESFRIFSFNVFSQINFPSTLKKLSLHGLQLPSKTLSTIAELHCVRVLKLSYISFMQPRLEMEDVVFQSLVFIALADDQMLQWNASIESLPRVEQLSVQCINLEELPPFFGEISTLKKITLLHCPRVKSSALRIQEEQIELGNHVEVDASD